VCPTVRENPLDEDRHSPDADPWWSETYVFDLWSRDGSVGAFTWLTLLPVQRRAWYWCALARDGLPLLHVADIDLPLPTVGLRVRTTGLWADHQCEAPFEQWTVRNECHAVALDDPADALGRAYGTAAPIAIDLEWYAAGPPSATPGGYSQAGEGHAVIEVVGGPLEVVGGAARSHTWGPLALPDGRDDSQDGAVAYLRGPGSLTVERRLTAAGWATAARGLPDA
jgi:hypothetical protein